MKELKIYNSKGAIIVNQLLNLKGKDFSLNYKDPIFEPISMITIIESKRTKKNPILKIPLPPNDINISALPPTREDKWIQKKK